MNLKLREQDLWHELLELNRHPHELSEEEFISIEIRLVHEIVEIHELRRRLQ